MILQLEKEIRKPLPSAFSHIAEICKSDIGNNADLQQVRQRFDTIIESEPAVVVGSDKTPALIWWVAGQRFKDSALLCLESATGQWRDLKTGDLWQQEAETVYDKFRDDRAAAKPAEQRRPRSAPATKAPLQSEKRSQSSGHYRDWSDATLAHKIFERAAWGLDVAENRLALEQFEREVDARRPFNPEIGESAAKRRQQGIRAAEHWRTCQKRLEEEGPSEEFDAFLASLLRSEKSPKVRDFVKRKVKKWKGDLISTQAKREAYKTYSGPSFAQPRLSSLGAHPNSLIHQPPASAWDVVIDETGKQFDADAEKLTAENKQLGRVVAVAAPKGVSLQPLEKAFHATEEADPARLDKLVEGLLSSQVGILGLTVKDRANREPHDWFWSIMTLVRWTLRAIPVKPGPKKVRFFIEGRADFAPGFNLDAWAETLVRELRVIDRDRYIDLDLQIHIVGKGGHELLGYADLVAHTWGGKNAKRLRRTRWQGHCLLQPTDEDLSRLALWLDNEQSPPPEDWLALMAGVDVLPVESFLGRYLQRLGHAVRKDLNLWKSLLAEVQRQLTLKTYSLQALVPALGWLRINAPAGSPLPPLLELKLRSANLASLNHQGAVNSTEALALLEQGEELLDESATDVASAWLRVLVSATNRFDFAQAQSIADRLAALPVQSVGLVNAGKIQSSLGQLLAFRGQPAQAVERFDEALGLFARLSDPDERRRESAQTGVYRHIALQDDPSVPDSSVQAALEKLTGRQTDQASFDRWVSRLAVSGQDRRWLHHLLLRTLTVRPGIGKALRKHYLKPLERWQDGEHHPWPLINLYRGWLLQLEGRPNESAKQFQLALGQCRSADGALTLQWMAEVIAALGRSLSLDGVPDIDEKLAAELAGTMPGLQVDSVRQLAQARSHDSRVALLALCLPFNFH